MSNNTRHTPGPWVWNEWTWLDGADGKPVLEYAGCGSHECEVNEANARLIAAAPALVEALKPFAKLQLKPGWHDETPTAVLVTVGDIRRADAALKAAGVEP